MTHGYEFDDDSAHRGFAYASRISQLLRRPPTRNSLTNALGSARLRSGNGIAAFVTRKVGPLPAPAPVRLPCSTALPFRNATEPAGAGLERLVYSEKLPWDRHLGDSDPA
jgi:hypothetical protein